MFTLERAQELHDNLIAAVARRDRRTVAFIALPAVAREVARPPLPWPLNINTAEFELTAPRSLPSRERRATLTARYRVIDGPRLLQSTSVWELVYPAADGRWRVAAVRALTPS